MFIINVSVLTNFCNDVHGHLLNNYSVLYSQFSSPFIFLVMFFVYIVKKLVYALVHTERCLLVCSTDPRTGLVCMYVCMCVCVPVCEMCLYILICSGHCFIVIFSMLNYTLKSF